MSQNQGKFTSTEFKNISAPLKKKIVLKRKSNNIFSSADTLSNNQSKNLEEAKDQWSISKAQVWLLINSD